MRHRTEPEARLGRFEIDLTSVCVRVGAIQLPFRLQQAFEEGTVAARDASSGGELELEFRSPRGLHGFKEYFASHGLRANDRVVLEFEAAGLRIEAVRRERPAAGKTAISQRKVDRIRTTPAPSGNLIGRSGAGDATAGGVDAASEATSSDAVPDAGAGGSGAPGRSGARPAAGNSRIVRERIRGNAPASLTAPDFGAGIIAAERVAHQKASARDAKEDGAAQARLPRWEPLDVMAPPDGWPELIDGEPLDAQRSPGHAVVREVRRSRGTYGQRPGHARAASEDAPSGLDEAGREPSGIAASREPASEKGRSREQLAVEAQAAALERVVAQRSVPRDSDRASSSQAGDGARSTTRAATPPRSIAQRVTVARLAGSRPITQHAPMLSRADESRRGSVAPAASVRSQAATPAASKRFAPPSRHQANGVRDESWSDTVASTSAEPSAVVAAAQHTRLGAAPMETRGFSSHALHDAVKAREEKSATEEGPRPLDAGVGKAGGGFLGLRRRFGLGRSQDTTAFSTETTSPNGASEAYPRVLPTSASDGIADAFLDFDQAPADGTAGETGPDARRRPWLPNGEYRPRDALTGPRDPKPLSMDGPAAQAAVSNRPSLVDPEPRPTMAARVATPTPGTATSALGQVPAATELPTASSRSQHQRPEEVMAVVEAYLARPDVPAIVRSELIAEVLGVATERVEGALVRIAEDRERVTRIRAGAYMVRRKPTAAMQADSDA